MPDDPCIKKVTDASDEELSDRESLDLLTRMRNMAKDRAAKGLDYEEALKDIAEQVTRDANLASEVELRAHLLEIRSRRQIRKFVKQFKTPGEGLRAFMEGSSKTKEGARLSVDARQHAVHGQYLGRLIAELESEGILRDFRNDELAREVYIEMEELTRDTGVPGSSGSETAVKIAKIVEAITTEMTTRQTRAGAYINRLPGYIVRQTHDMDQIRRAGGHGPDAKMKSYHVWRDFVIDKLDHERTFRGEDPEKFLKNVHEALFSGTHGPKLGEFEQLVVGLKFDLSKKASASRVLHFKDANAAFEYNHEFGIRSLRDQIMSDIYYRARSIALMESFGPRADRNFDRIVRELKEEARESGDAASIDSMNDWRIQTLYDVASGKVDSPTNHTLAKASNIARAVATLSKMGATVISALTDKVFMNAEYAYQGIKALDRWSSQITGMVSSPERTRMLRYMGVAMDGIIGSTVSRYTAHTSVAGGVHRLQQKLFDLNFLNWWTDTNKGAAAELMAAHLGDHSHLGFKELPGEISNVLTLYNITPLQWDALRSTAWTRGAIAGGQIPSGSIEIHEGMKFLTPDQVEKIPGEVIDKLVDAEGLKVTDSNRNRVRQELETKLRAYYADRVNFAVPTPGLGEKKWTTMGTKAGTPLGEAVRMVTMFKSFPLTILTKIMSREVYGRGSETFKHWMLNDHRGKFHTAQLIAMATAAGYMSGVIRDTLKGRSPKPLTNEDGSINMRTLADAASRGGGLGILGDYLFSEYDRGYRTLTGSLVGPVLGQLDPAAEALTLMKRGEYDRGLDRAGKLFLDNTPFINLFYIRPVLDYFIFWNLQEMMAPGSLKRTEETVREKNNQGFWLSPSETVR